MPFSIRFLLITLLKIIGMAVGQILFTIILYTFYAKYFESDFFILFSLLFPMLIGFIVDHHSIKHLSMNKVILLPLVIFKQFLIGYVAFLFCIGIFGV